MIPSNTNKINTIQKGERIESTGGINGIVANMRYAGFPRGVGWIGGNWSGFLDGGLDQVGWI